MHQPQIRLCLVLHNHQPIGNFEDVFEAAYQDSYLPFLDVFEPYEHLRISLHTSGPLATWLLSRHPEYVQRLSDLVSHGRIEVIGGAFYEPILAMIPSRDRRGQIQRYSQWLDQNIGGPVRGMWMPERVWESEFSSDLAESGIAYTVLDDYHFRRAGIAQEKLTGFFVTENEGQIVRVFPGSEKLRYLIPFQEPGQTVEYCRQLAETQPGTVLVFGDDGEKFGTWPDTKQHVYDNGWLRQFFDALTDNRDWLCTSTLAEAVTHSKSQGKVFLPDASYREMTEWSMPVEYQVEYDRLVHELEDDPHWERLKLYIAGGFWRNFKVKYPESNEMYSRMMWVSRKLAELESQGNANSSIIDRVKDHLYQGQCNCSYWHGAFGGIYLPHLRNAVYQQLIFADNLLERSARAEQQWVEGTSEDYDFDGSSEVRLANDQMVAWLAPRRGGMLYELDIRAIGHNLLATMQRRPESYHEKVRGGQRENDDSASSIHDRVVFKQQGLEHCLNYDNHLRKSLIDHFWDKDVALSAIMDGSAAERGDFVEGNYEATIRRNPDRVQVVLERQGVVFGQAISISKGITLNAGGQQLEIAYMMEGLPPNFEFHLGVEFNFAGLPAGQDDRFFRTANASNLGQLGTVLQLQDETKIDLIDRWLGLTASLEFEQPSSIWTYPIQSVSQSESGFELVHQSVVVQPHWIVRGDQNGRWVAKMMLSMGLDADSQNRNDDLIAVVETS